MVSRSSEAMKKVLIVIVLIAMAHKGNAAPFLNPITALEQVAQRLVQVPASAVQGAVNAVLDPIQGIAQAPRYLISKAVVDAIVVGSMAVLPSPIHPIFVILVQFLVAFINALYAIM